MRRMNTRKASGDRVSDLRGRVGGRGNNASFLCLVLFLGSLHAIPALGQVSVLTAQNDHARSGANLNESVLNTSNVN